MKNLKKTITLLLTALVVAASLAGCAGNTNKQELQKYVDEDLKAFAAEELQISSDLQQSISLLNGGNYVPAAKYIRETILPEAKALQDEASALTFTDPELQDIHNLYIDYLSDYIVGLNYLCKGIEDENVSQINNGEAKLNECNNTVSEYKNRLSEYAKNNGMKITYN